MAEVSTSKADEPAGKDIDIRPGWRSRLFRRADEPAGKDIDILRRLAERKAQIADDRINLERKAAWYKHDSGESGERPMVLAEVCDVRDVKRLSPYFALQCESKWARDLEMEMRTEIYQFEVLRDDHVVEARIRTNWQVQTFVEGRILTFEQVHNGYYGMEIVTHMGESDGSMCSARWDPPIQDFERDFVKLHPRTYSVNREATLAEKARLERVLGGILPVDIRGEYWWSLGMTKAVIFLVGLDKFMIYMMDNPDGLHRLMAFLRDDRLAFARWLEREGLLTLNNEDDYIGSGSMGYTRALPQKDYAPGTAVRMKDLWLLLESQESVGVGPAHFEEFIFPYQADIAKEFGRVYYGCCEQLHSRLHVVKRLPNLARISVSPWADEEFMAREIGRDYVYSRKPSPALISMGTFDEAVIRADLRRTLTLAKDCRLEIIMKDLYTLNGDPTRLPRWVQLVKEEAGTA